MRLSIRLGILWTMLVVAAVLLYGCAGTGSSSSASSSNTTTAGSNSSDQPSSSTQDASTTAVFRRPTQARGPLRTVQLYWHDIGAQNYRAAYRVLAPGSVTQTAADFVSAEQQAQIGSVSFQGSLASASTSAATVNVDSLITTDGQSGCRTWTGTYQLTRQAGSWLIARASIAPASCASTSTNSGTGTGTGNTGSTGSSACSPLTDSGNCYEPGEYCRNSDHDTSGVAGDGETITCEDSNGWRWEPG